MPNDVTDLFPEIHVFKIVTDKATQRENLVFRGQCSEQRDTNDIAGHGIANKYDGTAGVVESAGVFDAFVNAQRNAHEVGQN